MAITVLPYIPASITVHLGPPDSPAENVTVPFPDYIKNVASSEVYPTWQPSALRANILAQVSFALNRVYTEYYRSRGYSFDITNTTAYDQRFINGRNTFENVDAMVDQLYTTYIRREGYAEPLAAHFCNGTTTTCDGLSQWGSQALAESTRGPETPKWVKSISPCSRKSSLSPSQRESPTLRRDRPWSAAQSDSASSATREPRVGTILWPSLWAMA